MTASLALLSRLVTALSPFLLCSPAKSNMEPTKRHSKDHVLKSRIKQVLRVPTEIRARHHKALLPIDIDQCFRHLGASQFLHVRS